VTDTIGLMSATAPVDGTAATAGPDAAAAIETVTAMVPDATGIGAAVAAGAAATVSATPVEQVLATGPAPTKKRKDHKGDDWTRRRLCPDGACVGVIGSDGACRVCGKVG
jgi:hypothetical protein